MFICIIELYALMAVSRMATTVSNACSALEIANTTNVSIRVFDMSGKLVYTKSLDNLTEGVYTETINCQNMQKGVYLINVLTESQMMTSKLIVK